MAIENLRQLVGAMGAWLDATAHVAPHAERDQVSELILSGFLLGVQLDDERAPELEALTSDELVLVAQVRAWVASGQDEAALFRPAAQQQAVRSTFQDLSKVQPACEPKEPESETDPVLEPGLAAESEPEAVTISDAEPRAATKPQVKHKRVVSPAPVPPPMVITSTAVATVPDEGLASDSLSNSPSDLRRALATRFNEEFFWWAVCFVAVLVLVLRRFV